MSHPPSARVTGPMLAQKANMVCTSWPKWPKWPKMTVPISQFSGQKPDQMAIISTYFARIDTNNHQKIPSEEGWEPKEFSTTKIRQEALTKPPEKFGLTYLSMSKNLLILSSCRKTQGPKETVHKIWWNLTHFCFMKKTYMGVSWILCCLVQNWRKPSVTDNVDPCV